MNKIIIFSILVFIAQANMLRGGEETQNEDNHTRLIIDSNICGWASLVAWPIGLYLGGYWTSILDVVLIIFVILYLIGVLIKIFDYDSDEKKSKSSVCKMISKLVGLASNITVAILFWTNVL